MLLLGMLGGMFSTSCQDMLSPSSERHSYTVAEDTLYSYWGILKSLQNIAERYVILNECRGDLVDETSFVSDTIAAIANFGETNDPDNWKDGACVYLKISDYYHIINSCNAYIANCDLERRTGTNQKYMIKEYAQVQSIRAWVYLQLLYAYGENRVPFYKEPMLTTDDIYNFVDDKNHPMLTAQILAEELGPELEAMEPVEINLGDADAYEGLPNYNNYKGVCHSSKCMFPVSIVLGDLYLLSGNYMAAAQHYYNYINTQNCGPLAVDDYYCTGLLDDKKDYPVYDYYDNPYRETGAVSRSTESITCIPSNISKLDGRVLTDINRLFGFEAELETAYVKGNDEDEEDDGAIINAIFLSRKYERELIPSKGYEALCDDQKYEIYEGSYSGASFDWSTSTIEELPGVGDARRSWIYMSLGRQWQFTSGDNVLYGKMVAKQNPSGAFSPTYPVIYRKSTVWLRFAEALNRAGFPSYAFAILKTGLCDNDRWFPKNPKTQYVDGQGKIIPVTDISFQYNSAASETNKFDYHELDFPIKATDTLFHYKDTDKGIEVPEGWKDTERMSTYDELEAWLTTYFQNEYDASLETEEPMEAPRTMNKDNVYFNILSEESFQNYPDSICDKACYYLSRKEVERASNTPFLDFSGQPYLRGQKQTQLIYVKEQGQLFNNSRFSVRYPNDTDVDVLYTIGVHQRGCGFIGYDLDVDYKTRSSYNYLKMVGKKLKDYGITVADDDLADYVYDEANLANVQNAVEDLIIDEAALELAFEGSRFSDLCRVAMRRGDNDYLAKRVSKRHTGEINEALRERLKTRDNWWLPVPEE